MTARSCVRRLVALVVGSLLYSEGTSLRAQDGQRLPPIMLRPIVLPPAANPEPIAAPVQVVQPSPQATEVPPQLPQPTGRPGETALPINLPAALRLANARAWDITIATQQLRIAAAQLDGANVLWLPNLVAGATYLHYDGTIQANDGTIGNNSRSSFFAGAAPLLVVGTTDAIFAPLAQRQVTRAQQANVQTATNDTLTQVAQVYFDALEARADLAAIEDVSHRVAALVHKTESLVPELVPDVELDRVRAVQANVAQAVAASRQRWRVASAEVARVLRLEPTTLIEPLEPPQLKITLVSPSSNPEDLIPIALQSRPELTYTSAQVGAAEQRLSQEKLRPFLPILVVRGASTPTPYPMAVGTFGGGQGGDLNNFGLRADWDLEAVWEVKNLGFGNRALVREREGNLALAHAQDCRYRDVVAREIVQVWAELQGQERAAAAEVELKRALASAAKNLSGLGEIKRVGGNIAILVIRPQEAVAAQQALVQAYYDYFGSIADYNRAQFRMYRALGNPAQCLDGHDGLCGPALPAADGTR